MLLRNPLPLTGLDPTTKVTGCHFQDWVIERLLLALFCSLFLTLRDPAALWRGPHAKNGGRFPVNSQPGARHPPKLHPDSRPTETEVTNAYYLKALSCRVVYYTTVDNS